MEKEIRKCALCKCEATEVTIDHPYCHHCYNLVTYGEKACLDCGFPIRSPYNYCDDCIEKRKLNNRPF
jgi:predicted amidophosphoribosyltransferase